MKTVIYLFLLLSWYSVSAQVSINSDGASPEGSAMLEVKATDKGFLLPRLTSTQRDAISSPAEGLMIFCTDCGADGAVSVFSSSVWRTFSPCFISSPTPGTNTGAPGVVVWTWNAVADAIGYKWNTTNDYTTALNMGTSLTKTETGIACNTSYTRYVWSYNFCSFSTPATMTELIPASAPAKPTAGTHVSTKTQITWNWNTVSGATGYRWSNVNNFATATEMGLVTTKTENPLTCGNSYTRYVWAYNGCGYSSSRTLTQSTLGCIWICGDPLTINHVVSGGVAPVEKSVTYGTVTNIPGEPSKCWITRNLGASQQATTIDDTTEASAGWYWQFNRKQGYKHDGTTRTPASIWMTSISQDSDWTTVNDPCVLELGADWRIPTYTEWYNVDNTGGWTDWNGPWGSNLIMHPAGYLMSSFNGLLSNRGSSGVYWSSEQSNSSTHGWYFYFRSGYCGMVPNNKATGVSLRCLHN